MVRALVEWPFWLLLMVMCAVCLAVILGVGRLARRLPQHGESILVMVVTSTFGIILAFVIFVQWTVYTQMGSTIDKESGALASVLRYAQTFDPSRSVKQAVFDYRDAVVDVELPALREGDTPAAWKAGSPPMDRMVSAIGGVVPPPGTQRFHQLAEDQVGVLTEMRRERIQLSQSTLPASLWWFVIIAAMILLTIVPLSRPADSLFAVLMLSAVAVFYGLVFSLVITLNYPLSGALSADVDPYFAGMLAG